MPHLQTINLDQLAEEAVDAVIQRMRSDPQHRVVLNTLDKERIRKVYAETGSMSEVERRTKISFHHIRKVLFE